MEQGAMTSAQATQAIESILFTDSPADSGQETKDDDRAEADEGDVADQTENDTQDDSANTEEEETSEDEEASDDDTEAEEQQEQSLYTVKVNGKESKVTLDDLIGGYQKGQDYTQKTEAVAQQRREAEELGAKNAQALQQSLEFISLVEGFIGGPVHTMEQLKEINEKQGAEAYNEAVLQNAHRQQVLQALQTKRQEVTQQQQEEQKRTNDAYLAEQRQLLSQRLPGLKDKKGQQELYSYMQESFGVSEAEFGQIADHRVFVMADKARRFDAMSKKAKPKQNQQIPKVVRSKSGANTSGNSQQVDGYNKAMKNLRSTGSRQAAVEAIYHKLD